MVLKRYHASAGAKGALADGQALARIRSRYTPQCYDLERQGDALFLVLEYIRVEQPRRESSSRGPLLPMRRHSVIEQVAEGLEAVHACGLLHRDLKPSNIVLGDDRVPRLVDFGLAAHLGSRALQGLSGTPRFMAPEQARQQWERIDVRTDVYGLGAVLYALLTGQPPHPGTNQLEALVHASQGEVIPPRKQNRAIPPVLESIVLKTLAADPARRYAAAADTPPRLADATAAVTGIGSRLWCAVLVFAAAWFLWPTPTAREPGPTPASVVAEPDPALTGDLTVRVWSPGVGGKRGLSVEDAGALPVLAGEQVHLEAQLNQPAYAYLLWLDGQGQVVSLYPWRDHGFASRPSDEPARTTVHSPAALDKGYPLTGPAGLETALLLVRSTPLPPETNLAP